MTSRPARLDRRTALRSALALAAAPFAVGSRSARAGRGWCRSDPLISINGELADIFVDAWLDAPLDVTGPTEIVVAVPRGVRAALVLAGPGFGKGENVRFVRSRKLKKKKSGIQIGVSVFVPAVEEGPVGVEFAPRVVGILDPVRAEGTANRWVALSARF